MKTEARGIPSSALLFVYIAIPLSRRCLGIGSSAVPSNVQGDSIPTLRLCDAGIRAHPAARFPIAPIMLYGSVSCICQAQHNALKIYT